jgi:uncharacterized protein YjdB
MRSTVLRATLILLLLSASACSYVSQPADPDPSLPSDPDPSGSIVPVVAVKLVPQSVQLVAIGETRQLVVTVAPTNATDRAVTWESTDSTVVAVSASGVVTAKAAGVGVFITVTTHDGHHEASVNVSVVP